MADTHVRTRSTYPKTLVRRGTDWSAIWSGVFVFAAIWAVFESLAFVIFGATSKFAATQSNLDAGLALWTIVLTIIGMYVAGRETSRLAGVVTGHDGVIYGMMMFGLAMVGAFALAILAGAGIAAGGVRVAGTPGIYPTGLGAVETAFISLLVGWLAAMAGASTGVKRDMVRSSHPDHVQPAA